MLSRNKSPDQIGTGLPMPAEPLGTAQFAAQHSRQCVLIREIKIALRGNGDVEFFRIHSGPEHPRLDTTIDQLFEQTQNWRNQFAKTPGSAQVLGLMEIFGIDQTNELRVIEVVTPDESTKSVERFGGRQIVKRKRFFRLPQCKISRLENLAKEPYLAAKIVVNHPFGACGLARNPVTPGAGEPVFGKLGRGRAQDSRPGGGRVTALADQRWPRN